MKKPNFFIIGAPKCGTTSMSAWLGDHPKIFMSNPKEPFFFSTDMCMPTDMTQEKYLRLFENAADQHLAVGEASVGYLLSQVAVLNILEFNSDAKFIVMIRNPIDMAISWHGQLIASYQNVFDDFEDEWYAQKINSLETIEKHDKFHRLNWDPLLMKYEKVCKLGEQVQRLLQTVNVQSVHFIVMDDLISNPLREYKRVLEFLDIPYDGKTEFSKHNSAKRARYKLITYTIMLLIYIKRRLRIKYAFGLVNKLEYINLKPYNTPPLRPEFKQELIDYFTDDVNLLSSILNRDFSCWLR